MKSIITDQIPSSVYKISTLLTEPSSVDKVLKAIVETVKVDLKFNRCAVYLINKESKKLECKYITGFSPEKETFVMKRPFDLTKHSCIETSVAHTGEPILIKNFHTNRNISALDKEISERMERGCTLYVPLKIKGNVIGILGVDKKQDEPEINEKEFESLSILATYASVIIENSRLLEALLKEKRFSENVLNSSVNGILTTDIAGRITSFNPAAENILNLSNEGIKNRLIWEIIDSPDWCENLENVYKRSEISKDWEFILTNDNQDKIVSISESPIMDERDDFIGFMYFIQDVTVERQRDEYLQRMNRLIALGELAAGIAHEIRNPLTGIAVVLDILKGKKRLSRADNDLISQANEEIEGLEKLIANLLVFAKPKKFVFEFADMNDILTSICFLINEKCNKQSIELKLKLHENIPKSYMDHERIKQGLLNVVINAIQAMPKGGHLLLETDVYCENESSGRYIIVKINDTGVGISKEDLSRIFDPFFTTHNDGTGLGLSITHSIIKKHNGLINVDSEKGKGTQVTIHLPQNHTTSAVTV